jgi:hypothetical protein
MSQQATTSTTTTQQRMKMQVGGGKPGHEPSNKVRWSVDGKQTIK